jgi:hypothetical protein
MCFKVLPCIVWCSNMIMPSAELWRETCTLNCTLLLQARDMIESRRGNPTALTSLRLPVPRIRTVVSGCSFLPMSHLPSLGKAFWWGLARSGSAHRRHALGGGTQTARGTCSMSQKAFLDVPWCSLIFLDVPWCSLMSLDVPWCSLMFLDVPWCSLMSLDVYNGLYIMQNAIFKILGLYCF